MGDAREEIRPTPGANNLFRQYDAHGGFFTLVRPYNRKSLKNAVVWAPKTVFLLSRLASAVLLSQALFATVYAAPTEQKNETFFDIPTQRLDEALIAYAEQSDRTLVMPAAGLHRLASNPVVGRYARQEAIKILLTGTGLGAQFVKDDVLVIRVENTVDDVGENRKMTRDRTKTRFGLLGALLTAVAPGFAVDAQEQDGSSALEEIIVTAQRREQSLQEVPISLEVYTGEVIQRRGFRNIEQISNFSPSLTFEAPDAVTQELSIRGFGTVSSGLTIEQATPTFLDGVHLGRASQTTLAFMDLERIEILKGPQPVFFGQNATAGAFNLQTRKPTANWEGNVDVSAGNFGIYKAEVGAGGPLTETLGIRIAGLYEEGSGHLRDVISNNREIGEFQNKGARMILQWRPNDRFEVTGKVSGIAQDSDPQSLHVCSTGGPMVYGRRGPGDPGDEGNEQSVWADPPKGEGWNNATVPLGSCFENELGRSSEGPFYEPPIYIRERRAVTGFLDIREMAAAEITRQNRKSGRSGLDGYQDVESYDGYVELTYTFDNGMELSSQAAALSYDREFFRDDSFSPFAGNLQSRGEYQDQFSSELRITSPTGERIEFMGGLFYQSGELETFSDNMRANVRRGQRYNFLTQDTTWTAAFGTVTFNFLDDKFSIDLGGRYSKVEKDSYIETYGATWVFDVTPCAPGPDDDDGLGNVDPATCDVHPDAVMVDATGDSPRIFDSNAALGNLWTIPFRDSRETPSNWRSSITTPVGLTALDPFARPDFTQEQGFGTESRSESEFDPQVVLRWRPLENHSLFAKWAQAFKSGGFDSGVTTIPRNQDEFAFGPEYAESFEVGSKGTFLDGRARYDVTLFNTTFEDLQMSTANPSLDDPRSNLNAGKQRVRGVEFGSAFYFNDQFTMTFAGALMDGEMQDYPNAGCTLSELDNAPESGCDPATGKIDRSGHDAPRTPDWKFAVGLGYVVPIRREHELAFNADAYASDGYLTDVEGFDSKVRYEQHEDLDLYVSFGKADGSWTLAAFARNLLEARPTYNAEFDLRANGIETYGLPTSAFTTYGLQFQYRYQ